MNTELRERTAETVAIYFERANTEEIRRVLPMKARTLDEALEDYRHTLLPGAASFGRTIYEDGRYVGDVWCYCIHEDDEPDAMVSYCIFDETARGRGVATRALMLFMDEVERRFGLRTLGAFTYSANTASARVLEKSGFALIEEFEEDGVLSRYYQAELKI